MTYSFCTHMLQNIAQNRCQYEKKSESCIFKYFHANNGSIEHKILLPKEFPFWEYPCVYIEQTHNLFDGSSHPSPSNSHSRPCYPCRVHDGHKARYANAYNALKYWYVSTTVGEGNDYFCSGTPCDQIGVILSASGAEDEPPEPPEILLLPENSSSPMVLEYSVGAPFYLGPCPSGVQRENCGATAVDANSGEDLTSFMQIFDVTPCSR